MAMNGKIHSFQSLGTVDGPGVRFVCFLHGCNLSCGYCHNIDVCRGEYKELSAEEVFSKIKRYKSYFGKDGGVTVSGGEPLLQAKFVKELFTLCKNEGIHTALDTSGSLWNEDMASLLDVCDLVLLDIKMTNNTDYKQYIGCDISAPLAFLEELEKRNIPTWIRHVVVTGLNDTKENIHALKTLLEGKTVIEKIELLPFRKICEEKYKNMGIPFPFAKYPETTKNTIESLKEYLN